jgi:hypothetical protein
MPARGKIIPVLKAAENSSCSVPSTSVEQFSDMTADAALFHLHGGPCQCL